MKIALLTEYFFPDQQGGTELYVFNLAKALMKTAHLVEVIAVHPTKTEGMYEGIMIRYIPYNRDVSKEVISGIRAADNVGALLHLVKTHNYERLHFHTITPSLGYHHFKACFNAGFNCFLTSHVPGHTCMRGDLLHLGREICDGKIEVKRCSECYFHYRGMPSPLHSFLPGVFRHTNLFPILTNAAALKKAQINDMGHFLSKLIVVSEWQWQVFLRNNFDAEKLSLCRQAIEVFPTIETEDQHNKRLKISFAGRISPEKGLHLLLSALTKVDENGFELHVAAIPVKAKKTYLKTVKKLASKIKHLVWQENMPNTNMPAFLKNTDVLCVPSQGLETGPFVVYEALAAGVPVLGSNLGGIAELVRENVNGWLFPFNDTEVLKQKINLLISQKHSGKWISIPSKNQRTPDDLATEMIAIYTKNGAVTA